MSCSSFSFPSLLTGKGQSSPWWPRFSPPRALSGLSELPAELVEHRGQSRAPKANSDKYAYVNMAIKLRGFN